MVLGHVGLERLGALLLFRVHARIVVCLFCKVRRCAIWRWCQPQKAKDAQESPFCARLSKTESLCLHDCTSYLELQVSISHASCRGRSRPCLLSVTAMQRCGDGSGLFPIVTELRRAVLIRNGVPRSRVILSQMVR